MKKLRCFGALQAHLSVLARARRGAPCPTGMVGDCVVDLVTEIALSLRQQVCKTHVLIELQTGFRAASLRHAMRVSSDAAESQVHATRSVLGFLGGLSPLLFCPRPPVFAGQLEPLITPAWRAAWMRKSASCAPGCFLGSYGLSLQQHMLMSGTNPY